MIEKTAMRGRKEHGGILAWLLITFLLVAGCLVVAGVFVAHTIKVHQSRTGNDVQVDTPFGSVHVQHHGTTRPETAGMPLYPGAKPIHGGENASVDLSAIFGDKDLQIVAGKWETTDPIDKVQKFYEDKFPDMSVIQHGNKVEMHSVNGHGKRVVALLDRGGRTEIALASVGEPKAN
jgi:hypothetical protein